MERPTILAASLLLLFLGAPSRSDAQDPITLNYSILWNTISPTEPLVVDVEIVNHLSEDVLLNLGFLRQDGIRVKFTLPDGVVVIPGRPVSDRYQAKGGSAGPSPFLAIEGAGFAKARFILDEWFKSQAVGTYSVQIELADSRLRTQSGLILTFGSRATLNYHVVSEDRLHSYRCSTLENLLRDPSTGTDAALVLGAFSDPLVIPHLRRMALINSSFAGSAVRGLRRVGTSEAIQVLVELSRAEEQEVSQAASSALADFAGRR